MFSSLAKLLHLATRIKVEHKTNLSGILSYGRLFKTNWSCGVWHIWRACHPWAALANLETWIRTFRDSIRHRRPETATSSSFTPSRTGRQRNFPYHSRGNDGRRLRLQESDGVAQRLFQIEEEHSKGETKLSRSNACTRWANIEKRKDNLARDQVLTHIKDKNLKSELYRSENLTLFTLLEVYASIMIRMPWSLSSPKTKSTERSLLRNRLLPKWNFKQM